MHDSQKKGSTLRHNLFPLNLAQFLGLITLDALLRFVIDNKLHPKQYHPQMISPQDTASMNAISHFLYIDPQEYSVACLFYWRIVANCLKQLDVDQRELLKTSPDTFLQSHRLFKTVSVFLPDSHFHLDKLMESGIRYDEVNRYPFSIANYCFISNWPSFAFLDKLVLLKPPIFCSFGIHPLTVKSTQLNYFELSRLLRHRLCVGIGEFGFDLSNNHGVSSKSCQVEAVKEILNIAKTVDKTLVIHCRDKFCETEAFHLLLSLFKSSGIDNFKRIHFHCFLYTDVERKMWVDCCPNTIFGITKKSVSKHHLKNTLDLHLFSMVIESDAPYISKSSDDLREILSNLTYKLNCKKIDITAECLKEIICNTTRRLYSISSI